MMEGLVARVVESTRGFVFMRKETQSHRCRRFRPPATLIRNRNRESALKDEYESRRCPDASYALDDFAFYPGIGVLGFATTATHLTLGTLFPTSRASTATADTTAVRDDKRRESFESDDDTKFVVRAGSTR